MATFWTCVGVFIVPFALCSVYFILAELHVIKGD